jgi:hypothetical protein
MIRGATQLIYDHLLSRGDNHNQSALSTLPWSLFTGSKSSNTGVFGDHDTYHKGNGPSNLG